MFQRRFDLKTVYVMTRKKCAKVSLEKIKTEPKHENAFSGKEINIFVVS